MRLLNTNSVDGLRAIAVLHIVLGHHSTYTGYIAHTTPSTQEAPDADEADAFGCSTKWCTGGSLNCWAGSDFDGCTCALGEARMTGRMWPHAFYEGHIRGPHAYECCLPSTNYTDLVGVTCGSYIPADDPMHRTTSGLDLIGGASMSLFYIISGFVLMLGYGSVRPVPRGTDTSCCGDGTSANAGCCFPCFCAPTKEVEAEPAEAPLPPLSARDFYIKRFARIGPLWYLGNLLAVPLYFTGHTHATGAWWWGGFVLSLFPLGLNSWTVLFFPPAGHLWTISTMTFFYLLFPRIAIHLTRVHPKQVRTFACALYGIQLGLFVCMLFGAGAIFGGELGYWWARVWPPIRLPTFVMGMLAARQAELEAKDPALSQNCYSLAKACRRHYATALLLVWLLIVVLGILEQLFLTSAGFGYLCRIAGEAALPILFYELIVALAYPASAPRPPSTTHAFLGSEPLRRFANISLAVYVVHQTLIIYMTLAAYGVLWPGAFATNGGPEVWRSAASKGRAGGALMLMPKWGTAATLPLSIFLGWLLTYGFERPMSRAIRRCVASPTRRGSVAPRSVP
ncbi:hypothetical protein EMIHUDRAFT_454871 [Emiliania huxleyi CCMP1516]|uniref:Acyltransferase 3 domain-containing protein n=2 Tax=Emiliania huxleyi TaxID=2903 RepID=A0A0D3KP24_EMIH1|nr:hypothetical protein EMIHUDRAFT_454871 [Emiliania huxleyi CCMP1516]EOD37509.1 hypothetical protein EMIHUDRAFT_454871 [Emiliania huxleyi CCMP1516]|eukprot:XP_005789938.1 hypothetical protein EMIHUDRAFT_454871 [Emiliania huxleyi CCMP1516]